MTEPIENPQDTILRLGETITQLQAALQEKDTHIQNLSGAYTELQARVGRVQELEETTAQMTAQRNNAQQALAEQGQELDRVRTVLQDTVSGVQTWVPDLAPVPQPPATVPPEQHAAWIQDQIAQRRSQWDTFVNRVVTQANV